MLRWILPPIILALAVYPFLPKQETCVLLILEVSPDGENVIQQLMSRGNIKHAFRIHSNVFDKGIDTETKDLFNFALITNHVESVEEIAKIEESVKSISNIKNSQVLPFPTSAKATILNVAIFFKKQMYKLFPSLMASMTKKNTEDKREPRLQQVCDDKSLEKAGPLIVVNLMKIKDPEALAKYTTPAAFHFFPQLDVKLLLAGGPSVDYWDYIMVAEYQSQESFCRMAVSKEYTDIVPHKARALEDAQAYLSTHLKV